MSDERKYNYFKEDCKSHRPDLNVSGEEFDYSFDNSLNSEKNLKRESLGYGLTQGLANLFLKGRANTEIEKKINDRLSSNATPDS